MYQKLLSLKIVVEQIVIEQITSFVFSSFLVFFTFSHSGLREMRLSVAVFSIYLLSPVTLLTSSGFGALPLLHFII